MANQKNTSRSKNRAERTNDNIGKKQTADRSVRRTSATGSRVRTGRKKMPAKQYELLVLLVMGVAILLAIAVYFQGSGKFLGAFRYFVFGGIGIAAYILPLLILVAALFKAFNQGNQRLDDKIKLAVLALLDISVFAHIFYVAQPQINLTLGNQKMFFPVLANFFRVSGRHHVGGGFVGGLFGDVFLILLGKWGAFVLALLLMTAILLLLTEIRLVQVLEFIRKIIRRIYGFAVQQILEVRERQKTKKEEKSDWEQAIIETELAEQEALTQEKAAEEGASDITEKMPVKKKKKFSFINVDLSPQEDLEDPAPQTVMETEDKETAVDDRSKNRMSEGEDATEQPENIQTQKSKAQSPEMSDLKETDESQKVAGDLPERRNPFSVPDKKTEVKPETKPNIVDEQKAIQEEMRLGSELKSYSCPPLELLKEPAVDKRSESELIENNAQKLEETLQSFGVSVKVVNVSQGPTVTRYEIQPAQGVKVSRIVGLADDIALNLAAAGIRMEAPIPGKSAIGIEVPNKEAGSVMLREVIDSQEFQKSETKLSFGLGKDITGKVLVTDIGKMPHLLIAGATGSGKSVCINTLIVSLLYKAKPEEVRLLMIDPKVVELSIYNGIPHLLIPVVTDAKKAAGALNWAVQEMNDRYKLFAAASVRDLKGYNKLVEEKGDTPKLPQIVIIVDELADLMMVASNEVEDAIVRLSQMARAAGLHLIIATQRPSVDVITGLIKANVPSRIAFNVSSGTDSRTIIDMNGAEKLLGKGDMLFYPVGYSKPVRIQGAFISDHEVENIVEYLRNQQQTQYNQKIMNHLNKSEETGDSSENKDDLDEFFADALELVVDKERASASMIQRYFRVGFNRAARILDQLTEAGYVGEEQGSKPREVLLTRRELEDLKTRAGRKVADSETAEAEAMDFGEANALDGESISAQKTEPSMEPADSLPISSFSEMPMEVEQPSTQWQEQSMLAEASDLAVADSKESVASEKLQDLNEEEPVNDVINEMLEEMQAREDRN